MLGKAKDIWVVVFEPLRVIHNNKLIFFSIALSTTLPLSFLLFTLSLTTHTLRSHIYHLEALATLTSTLMEARHVWHESRDHAVHLLRVRSLYFVLCFPLSLAAVVSSVHTTYSFIQGKAVSVSSTVNAVRDNWRGPFVTAILVYAILMAFSPVPRVVGSVFVTRESRFVVMVIGAGFEVYLMAVMGLGLVVSVVEERFGWNAIIVGSGLMQGKRLVFGWLISVMFVMVSGFIYGKMEGLNSEMTSVWVKMILICSYGLMVVFSYVVTTVFYCECRTPLSVRERETTEQDVDCISLSTSL